MTDQPAGVGATGSRWAPIVVFGGIVSIAVCGVAIVFSAHCSRETPYLDAEEIEWRSGEVRTPPAPIRPTKDLLLVPKPANDGR